MQIKNHLKQFPRVYLLCMCRVTVIVVAMALGACQANNGSNLIPNDYSSQIEAAKAEYLKKKMIQVEQYAFVSDDLGTTAERIQRSLRDDRNNLYRVLAQAGRSLTVYYVQGFELADRNDTIDRILDYRSLHKKSMSNDKMRLNDESYLNSWVTYEGTPRTQTERTYRLWAMKVGRETEMLKNKGGLKSTDVVEAAFREAKSEEDAMTHELLADGHSSGFVLSWVSKQKSIMSKELSDK